MVKLTEALVLARSRASDLDNVRKFNCWASDLTDVSILRRMPNVQIVSLSVNRINTLSDLSYCKHLEELYIRKNDIPDLSEIIFLKHLSKLRILWLADNPCAEGDKYRFTVLKYLPNLQKLDNMAVEEAELNRAVEEGLDLATPEAARSLETPQPSKHLSQFEPCTAAVAASMPSFSAMAARPSPESGVSERNQGASVTSSSAAMTSSCDQGASLSGELNGAMGGAEDSTNPNTVSWEETNKIRVQLGLKPLPVEKVAPLKPRSSSCAKTRNANILQAALHLVKELDGDSLQVVADAVRNRLESL